MAISIYEFPYDIPKTYYKAIGEVITKMALAELQVMQIIGRLLKLQNPKQVRVSFMGMGMKARLGAMQALASNWAPTATIKQELCSIAKELRKMKLVRDCFAHGTWGYKSKPKRDRKRLYVASVEESKDFYMPKAKHYTSADIIAKVVELRVLLKRLKRAKDTLGAVSP